MPKSSFSGEKRTFESDAYGLSDLQLQARSTRGRGSRPEAFTLVDSEEAAPDQIGFLFKREVILRLIDWLKEM